MYSLDVAADVNLPRTPYTSSEFLCTDTSICGITSAGTTPAESLRLSSLPIQMTRPPWKLLSLLFRIPFPRCPSWSNSVRDLLIHLYHTANVDQKCSYNIAQRAKPNIWSQNIRITCTMFFTIWLGNDIHFSCSSNVFWDEILGVARCVNIDIVSVKNLSSIVRFWSEMESELDESFLYSIFDQDCITYGGPEHPDHDETNS